MKTIYFLMSEDCDSIAASESLDKLENKMAEHYAEAVMCRPENVEVALDSTVTDEETGLAEMHYNCTCLTFDCRNPLQRFGVGYTIAQVKII